MHPSDVARIVRTMPLAQRRQLAESMDDERLADVLEELPETEQLRLIEGLDLDRLVGVLDEMEYDDLADLLNEMPVQQRSAIIAAMDDDEAEVVTRLLSYEEATAGGMMTPEIVILGPTDTVAEALARIRDPDWTPIARCCARRAAISRPNRRLLLNNALSLLKSNPPGFPISLPPVVAGDPSQLFFASLAHASLSVIVRLKTGFPGALSLSSAK
jgi:hypothetical protein